MGKSKPNPVEFNTSFVQAPVANTTFLALKLSLSVCIVITGPGSIPVTL